MHDSPIYILTVNKTTLADTLAALRTADLAYEPSQTPYAASALTIGLAMSYAESFGTVTESADSTLYTVEIDYLALCDALAALTTIMRGHHDDGRREHAQQALTELADAMTLARRTHAVRTPETHQLID